MHLSEVVKQSCYCLDLMCFQALFTAGSVPRGESARLWAGLGLQARGNISVCVAEWGSGCPSVRCSLRGSGAACRALLTARGICGTRCFPHIPLLAELSAGCLRAPCNIARCGGERRCFSIKTLPAWPDSTAA